MFWRLGKTNVIFVGFEDLALYTGYGSGEINHDRTLELHLLTIARLLQVRFRATLETADDRLEFPQDGGRLLCHL